MKTLPISKPDSKKWRPCMKRPVVVHVRDAVPGEEVFTREGLAIAKDDDMVMLGVDNEVYEPATLDDLARAVTLASAAAKAMGGP